MTELFPVAAGVLLGALVCRISALRPRIAVLVVLSVALGALASLLSGELALSLGFIPVDVAEVLAVSALSAGAGAARQRRLARVA